MPGAIVGGIEKPFDYDLSVSVGELRETWDYNEACQRTMPGEIHEEALEWVDRALFDSYERFVSGVAD